MRTVILRGATRSDGDPAPVVVDVDVLGDATRPAHEVWNVDATDLLVASGLIDLQVNGAAGVDLTTEPERVWDLARTVAGWGVTAFLPTLVSPSDDQVRALAGVLDDGPPAGWRGAVPLGIHAEGPYLAPARRGTHPVGSLRADVPADRGAWPEAVRMVTLAPELPGALEAVRALAAAGVVVGIGHTDATAEEVRAAVRAGARSLTHCWNAMRPLHHRDPGPVGVGLSDDRLTLGLVADGVHVADEVLALTFRAAAGRVALVTDATAASGGVDGPARLAGVEVTVSDGVVRNGDGVLAGSATTLDACLRHVAGIGVPEGVALDAASGVPARLLGARSRGRLAAGARADLVLLDAELGVRAVLVAGEVVVDHDGRFAG